MRSFRQLFQWGLIAVATGAASLGVTTPSLGQKATFPGVTETEIRIGNTAPYSGPASAYSAIAKTEAAYFTKINTEGGINGRKIKFISHDDGYSAPKTVEQTRKLVEGDDVLLVFQTLGTPPNSAIQKYMNLNKVPHLFVSSGAAKFSDPKTFPWTMGWNPTLENEGRIYGRYILDNHPGAKIGVLYQNDDYGKEMLNGLRDALGTRANALIVAQLSYETTDPTIDSQIVKLKSSGVDLFVNISTNKAAAQAIRKIGELGWKPVHIVNSVANSVGAVLEPAGLELSKDLLSAGYIMDPTDPSWKETEDYKVWQSFMDEYYPSGDKNNIMTAYGYTAAQALVQVLRQCGDDLSRTNVMKQAANLRNYRPLMLLPGSEINTSSDNYSVVRKMQMMRFDGKRWQLFGPLL
ncbi:MAG: ABC transporter substrate-binding protein [Bradyrhizobium sp.]|uniref:ABC transporter substrate-binding protein n=1 Tax=Bradyrhizobium sp. TaxID=376 RepID=UPI0027223AD0|nr:ABC transporter substrate-binding protein [Bradyrhizobium sp.]MDO8400553.1 ABC transporter substrate-binding protein [Bradyrhizobium sp.]